jgi:PHD/YefM family antitoxin component YafN of YafNO toxin-antitoxin module
VVRASRLLLLLKRSGRKGSKVAKKIMLKIKPEIWTKSGGEQFVVLSLADFKKVQEAIEDAGLSRILREAKRKESTAATASLADVKKKLGLTGRRRPQTSSARRS